MLRYIAGFVPFYRFHSWLEPYDGTLSSQDQSKPQLPGTNSHAPDSGTVIHNRAVTSVPMDCSPAIPDMISPDNDQFIQHLQSHGDQIQQALAKEMAIPAAQRTVPMPGMGKLVSRVKQLVSDTILPDSRLSASDKALYQQLIEDFKTLSEKNYPWNESFVLTYKAAHFISFYYSHFQQVCTAGHRSRYKPGATLESLQNLPWNDVLTNFDTFTTELDKVWDSFHLKFLARTGQTQQSLNRFCFPCGDELDLAYFIRTAMLGIFPLGFITGPDIRFDGAYGRCADFFEHDMLHNGCSLDLDPKLYTPAGVLMDQARDGCWLHCRVDHQEAVTAGQQALTRVKIPKEALELLLFEITHERGRSWLETSPDFYRKMVNYLFEQPNHPDSGLRSVYDNLPPDYIKVRKWQVRCAALLLQRLASNRFWWSESQEQAKNRLEQAMTQAIILPPDNPAISEVRNHDSSYHDFLVSADLPEIRKHGLISCTELTEAQLAAHSEVVFCPPEQTLAPEDIPLATFFAHPDWISVSWFTTVRNRLAELNPDPAAKALISSIRDLGSLRQLLKNHRFCDMDRLRCFDNIVFYQPDLNGLVLSGFSFQHANLNQCCLKESRLDSCNFSYASMQSVNMSRVRVYDTSFDHADLQDSDLSGLSVCLFVWTKVRKNRTRYNIFQICTDEPVQPWRCQDGCRRLPVH